MAGMAMDETNPYKAPQTSVIPPKVEEKPTNRVAQAAGFLGISLLAVACVALIAAPFAFSYADWLWWSRIVLWPWLAGVSALVIGALVNWRR
jgi:hypothetical protein